MNSPSHPLLSNLPWAETTTEAERALVWAFRHWVCGHVQTSAAHWSMVWQRLNELCGADDGTRAVTALEGMIRVICRHAVRPISYHQPHCPCLGEDERSVVELIAACQQRQWLNAAMWARRLVDEEGAGDLIEPAARLAALLAGHGHHLPANRSPSPEFDARNASHAAPVGRLH